MTLSWPAQFVFKAKTKMDTKTHCLGGEEWDYKKNQTENIQVARLGPW